MDHEKLRFYDIEVFEHDSLVVFKNYDNTITDAFWNDDPNRAEKIRKIITEYTLVGFNNYHYDDYVLTAMLEGKDSGAIKELNDRIIHGSMKKDDYISPLIKSLDTLQQILTHPSLKLIEGNLGMSIVESSVDFLQKEALTQEQKEETVFYCCHDVEATIEVFKLRETAYFDVKESLIEMLPEEDRERASRWNTTTISARLLKSEKSTTQWSGIRIPEGLFRQVPGIPEETWVMWESLNLSNINEKGNFVTTELFGCEITFGVGGLHGAPTQQGIYENVVDLDVSSMYPSIITLKEIRALGKATDVYDKMREERIRIKKTDKTKANALKLILNSVYGNFKNEYSTLCNPFASASVTIYGQIAAMALCDMLNEAGYQIININTDGVVIVDRDDPIKPYSEIQTEWQKKFGINLEIEKFKKWIQRDVNNYIAVDEEDNIKVKGGDTKKYHECEPLGNADARIIHIALVDYLLQRANGEDITAEESIERTFSEWIDKPEVWMYVLKAGSTFKDVEDLEGNVQQNVNRVFAAKEGIEGVTSLRKVKSNGQVIKFQSAPERMIIFNDDLSKMTDPEAVIDTDHYKIIVLDKIKQWTEPKKVTQKRKKKSSEDKQTEETEQEQEEEKPVKQKKKPSRIEKILPYFPDAKKAKRGYSFRCPCPDHGSGKGDRTASAYLWEKKDGIHVMCHAGCEEKDILISVGLKLADLGRESEKDDTLSWLDKKIEDLKTSYKTTNVRLVDHYDYVDENGKYLYTKIRYLVDDDPQKHMRYIRKHGRNNYFDGKDPLYPDPVLFNLSKLIYGVKNGFDVFYVEGEKDVKTLESLGFTETNGKVVTTAGGVNDWRKDFARYFVGARLTIFIDNDPPGKELGEHIVKDVKKYAFSTRIIKPSSQDKGDVTDYIADEGDAESLKDMLEPEENPWKYAGWVSEKMNKDGSTSLSINEGLLQQTVERGRLFYISRRINDNKDSLFIYNGKCYHEIPFKDINGMIQRYIPSLYRKSSIVSNVARLIADSGNGTRINQESMDENDEIIICDNGVIAFDEVDPKTGVFNLQPHSPKYKLTSTVKAKYDPNAQCPLFMSYIHDLCRDQDGNVDQESVDMVQEYCGLVISNMDVMKTKKCLVMSSREGNSGKSQLFKVFEFLIGSEEMEVVSLPEMNRDKNKFSLANIVSKRLIYQPDGTNIVIRDTSVFKQLVGGDRITVEGKGRDTFSYRYKGGMIIACNGVPIFSDDKGNHVFERLLVLNIVRSIPEDKRDPNIAEKMEKEKDGIFLWMLEGLMRFIDNDCKLTIPARSRESADELRKKSDSVYQYISEKYVITKNPKDVISKSFFDDDYREWYEDSYPDEDLKYAVAKRNIPDRLESYGVLKDRGRIDGMTVMRYVGIRKKSREELENT